MGIPKYQYSGITMTLRKHRIADRLVHTLLLGGLVHLFFQAVNAKSASHLPASHSYTSEKMETASSTGIPCSYSRQPARDTD
jgi:hypothetical protein